MSDQIIINANQSEIRVALTKHDQLAELRIERRSDRSLVGNIYKAKILRVLPGMQSAFVDIGEDRAAFLYGGDVIDPQALNEHLKTDVDVSEFANLRDLVTAKPIEKVLRAGQEVIVQVSKDSIGGKGARVSMFLSLPGRYLVLLPGFRHTGVSRRIIEPQLRQELADQVSKIKAPEMGAIVRTAAADTDFDQIKDEFEQLVSNWENIEHTSQRAETPQLLYGEPEIHLKMIRDLYSDEVSCIIVDSAKEFEKLRSYFHATDPTGLKKLKLYTDSKPIFDLYGIERDIERALGKKVWLPSGGYLVIDQTEALTSFDVNTGGFIGKAHAEETILKTNLEAVFEIVAQLRLRNIGGIIVIDFIDMDNPTNREKVFDQLEKALQDDKAKTNVLKISELGLVQMTRKRTRESLEQLLTEDCPHCQGRGRVRSMQTQAYDFIRDVIRHSLLNKEQILKVRMHKDLHEWLLENEANLLDKTCNKHKVKVEFVEKTESLLTPAYEFMDS